MNLSNIVLWETLHNNAYWDCFRILTVLEILKTQNRRQRDFCAYLGVTRLFALVGCIRNKLLFRTVQRNLKLFLLMQVCEWMEFTLLIFWIWLLKCCILLPTNRGNERMYREVCCMTRPQENEPRTKSRLQFSTTVLNCATSIMFPQTSSLLNLVRCSTFFLKRK